MKMNKTKTIQLAAFILFTLVSAYCLISISGNRALREVNASLKQKGMPTNLEELQLKSVPNSENAALFYQQAILTLKTQKAGEEDLFERLAHSSLKGDPKSLELSEAYFATQGFQSAYNLIRLGNSQKHCEFKLDFAAGTKISFEEILQTQKLSQVLQNYTAFQIQKKNPVLAWESILVRLAFSKHQQGNFLFQNMTASGQNNSTCASIRKIYNSTSIAPAEYSAIDQLLAATETPEALMKSFEFELAYFPQLFGSLSFKEYSALFSKIDEDQKTDGFWQGLHNRFIPALTYYSPFRTADYAHFLKSQMTRREAAQSSALQWLSNSNRPTTDKFPLFYYLSRNSIQQIDPFVTYYFRSLRMNLVTRAGLAAIQYKKIHGQYPESLQECLSTPLLDPFTEAPLVYQRKGNGFEIRGISEEEFQKFETLWGPYSKNKAALESWEVNQ